MSNTQSVVANYEKIQRASVMEADEFLFKNISQIIEYRKKVAIDMINCNNDDTYKNLQNVYERSEWHLKELLGLS